MQITLTYLKWHCKINLILFWLGDLVIFVATGATKFAITDRRRYVPFVTLLTLDNTKLLQKLKSGFKRTINWNKYQPKVTIERQYQYRLFK